ncbi:hypothetical protein Q8F55_004171 [Vanrija albida]|uniref:Right handed beta helix domain-containing protein n=1 Tax=Vanrija albida TaxID=181172 RepID=A0ABR3Q693_9TREE
MPRQRAEQRRHPRGGHLGALILAIAALALVPLALAADRCVRKADAPDINRMFTDGGPGTKVWLCPGVVYKITSTIAFTAADQQLATLGYKSGSERAVLRIDNPAIATAIQGDCRRCARVAIRNVIVDGARATFGRVRGTHAPGLVVLGGNEGHSVRESWITDPRGFTAIHIREGDKLSCKGATIERNEIGPVGEEYDPAVDGPDPEMSPLGRPLADGISIACRDSVVRDNKIWDCTDAGIVVYCSPGTQVAANRIMTLRRSAMGGILMVDATPFDGDYTGVVVKDNILDAASRAMRVGVGVGLSILSDDIDTILRGGSVISNVLKGMYMGFGIAAAGLKGWTIRDNHSDARHQGKRSPRCFDDPVNPAPTRFLYHGATVTDSTIQDGFVDSDFAYVVCIDGLEDGTEAEVDEPEDEPAPVEPEPEAAPAPAAAADSLSTGSDVLDGILHHSQARLLEGIADIGKYIDTAVADAAVRAQQRAAPRAAEADAAGLTDLSPLDAHLAQLEAHQTALLLSTHALTGALRTLAHLSDETGKWEGDVLRRIQDELALVEAAAAPQAEGEPAPGRRAKAKAAREASHGLVSTLSSSLPVLLFGGAAVALAAYGLARWKKSSATRLDKYA